MAAWLRRKMGPGIHLFLLRNSIYLQRKYKSCFHKQKKTSSKRRCLRTDIPKTVKANIQAQNSLLFRLKKKKKRKKQPTTTRKTVTFPGFFWGFLELFSLDKPLLPSLLKTPFSALLTHNVSLHKKLLHRNASIPTKAHFWGSDNARIQNCCCLLSNFTVSHNSLSMDGILTFWFHNIHSIVGKKKSMLKK